MAKKQSRNAFRLPLRFPAEALTSENVAALKRATGYRDMIPVPPAGTEEPNPVSFREHLAQYVVKHLDDLIRSQLRRERPDVETGFAGELE